LQRFAGVAAIAEIKVRVVERRRSLGESIAVFERGGATGGEIAMGVFEGGESGGRIREPPAAGFELEHKFRDRRQEVPNQALKPLEVIERVADVLALRLERCDGSVDRRRGAFASNRARLSLALRALALLDQRHHLIPEGPHRPPAPRPA
jgi:hypothetical protein